VSEPTNRNAILLTGWRGATGSAIVRRLREQLPDRPLIGLSRAGTGDGKTPPDILAAVQSERADMDDADAVRDVFARRAGEASLLVHVAHITWTPLVLALADEFGIARAVCVHTAAVYSKYREYAEGYRKIEAEVFAHPPARTVFTVLRPTMIYGTPRDKNMHLLIERLAKSPVFPIFGDGKGELQPVHADDLAQAVVAAVLADHAVVGGKGYDISGGSVVTYREAVDIICRELGANPRRPHLPLPVALPLVRAYNAVANLAGKTPRVTVEQVERLQENKSRPHTDAARDLGFAPRPFVDGVKSEIALLREAGKI